MLGINAGRFMTRTRARFDLRRVGGGISEHDLQRTILMPAALALLGSVLCLNLLEEVGAGHGLD